MTEWRIATPTRRGQLFWLELQEFPDRPKVAVRFHRMSSDDERAEIEIIGGDRTLFFVDAEHLLEEV